MTAVSRFFIAAIGFLAGLAIFSRLITTPNSPDLITSGFNALTNFFRGAFDQ